MPATFDQNIPALCHEGRDTGPLTNAAENNSIVEEASLSDTDAAGEANASLCAGISRVWLPEQWLIKSNERFKQSRPIR